MAAEEEKAVPTASPGAEGDMADDDGAGTAPHAAAAAAVAAAAPPLAKKARPPPALPWMRVPVPIGGGAILLEDVRGLDGRIEAWLRGAGFTTLFPVQAATWAATAGGLGGSHDLAIASPTGSGKTLGYGLPLVHALLAEARPSGCGPSQPSKKASKTRLARRPPRLGALVIVPTRDLAAQVHAVVAGLCEAAASGEGGALLTAALVSGARPPAEEAAALAGPGAAGGPPPLDYPWPPGDDAHTPSTRPADVVIATPGRLAAHLAALGPETSAHALAGVRFLVVDEADRLLRQAYGGWAASLASALPPPGAPTLGGAGPRTVRLAASATLTRDPARLAGLGLWRPRFLSAAAGAPGGPSASAAAGAPRYALPPGLVDWRVDVPGAGGAAHKPAALVALLRQIGEDGGGGEGERTAGRALRCAAAGAAAAAAAASSPSPSPASPPPPPLSLGPALIFASSVSTASAVAAFLTALDPPLPGGGGRVALLARGVPPTERAAALAAFSAGRLAALVASDGAARGLDFQPPPGTAAVVISYDPPSHAKALVHRAGRAARAGRAGVAFTLLTGTEAAPFKRLRGKVAGAGPGGGAGGGREWVLPRGAGWIAAKAAADAAVAGSRGHEP